MSIQSLALILGLMTAAQDSEPDPAAVAMTNLRLHARARCQAQPRADGETVEACAERRITALLATYGAPQAALTAVGAAQAPSPFGSLGSAAAEEAARRDLTAPPPPASPSQPSNRCRRETSRSADGTSSSTRLVCGNGGEAERAARDMLERLRSPD